MSEPLDVDAYDDAQSEDFDYSKVADSNAVEEEDGGSDDVLDGLSFVEEGDGAGEEAAAVAEETLAAVAEEAEDQAATEAVPGADGTEEGADGAPAPFWAEPDAVDEDTGTVEGVTYERGTIRRPVLGQAAVAEEASEKSARRTERRLRPTMGQSGGV